MFLNRILILWLAILFCPLNLAASPEEISLDRCGLVSTANNLKTLKANFSQERTINGLSRPLISSGQFFLTPGKEIVWETIEPINTKVVVRNSGIELSSKDQGSEKTEIHSDYKFRELSKLLLSLHSLSKQDTEKLSKNLSLSCFAQSSGQFKIVAIPKSSTLKRVLEKVVIQGIDKPTRITLSDIRGDTTKITFNYQIDK